MASLPIPITTITTPAKRPTLSLVLPAPPSRFSKPVTKRPSKTAVSCKAGDNNVESHMDDSPPKLLDRRNMLIGLGGLYGATSLYPHPTAIADPIAAPDITKCDRLPGGERGCCPPVPAKIIDFKPTPSSPPRVRRAAHSVDEAYVEKFSEALRRMKDLPADDPRSFMQQANIHCAYCSGGYSQVGLPCLELQVHSSWLFFPFHRFFLYFFERILGELIEDPSFSIPFWNWDSDAGMEIPPMFNVPGSPLYDALRNPDHLPPAVVDYNYDPCSGQVLPREAQIGLNNYLMYRSLVSGAGTAELFLGRPYRAGDEVNPGPGTVERIPHNTIHNWCGDPTHPDGANMGDFTTAGRDPLFYGHHANVDRMWSIWKQLPGRRNKDFTDPDWLDSEFLFYNEDKEMVRVKVRDCLETENLGYVYEDVPLPWRKPPPSKLRVKRAVKKLSRARFDTLSDTPQSFPRKLSEGVRVLVDRPKKLRSRREKEEEEEVLVIEGIEFEADRYVKFDVFVNEEEEEEEGDPGPLRPQYAGSFVNVPHKHGTGRQKTIKTRLSLGITELLEDLGVEEDDNLVVTVVPRCRDAENINIGRFKIEFQS